MREEITITIKDVKSGANKEIIIYDETSIGQLKWLILSGLCDVVAEKNFMKMPNGKEYQCGIKSDIEI